MSQHSDRPDDHDGAEGPADPQNQSGEPGQSESSGVPHDGGRWEDAEGQPRYGVRLPEGQQPPVAPNTSSAPHQYGRFTRHAQPGSQPGTQPGAEYGSEYRASSPQGQYPQQQYSQYPQQQFPQQPQHTMPQPNRVRLASRLIGVAGLLYAVLNIVTAFLPRLGVPQQQWDQLQEMFTEVDPTVSLDEMVPAMRFAMVAIALLLGFVYWVIARGVARGSNAARIIGTALAVLSLPGLFGFSAVYVLLGAIGIGMTFTAPANEYFRYKAWERFNARNQPPR
ncbi:MAG: hypothetical protein ACTHZ5_06460 [Micrococcaceae bacterium]